MSPKATQMLTLAPFETYGISRSDHVWARFGCTRDPEFSRAAFQTLFFSFFLRPWGSLGSKWGPEWLRDSWGKCVQIRFERQIAPQGSQRKPMVSKISSKWSPRHPQGLKNELKVVPQTPKIPPKRAFEQRNDWYWYGSLRCS